MQANLTAVGRKLVVIVDPHIKRDNSYFLHNDAEANSYYVKNKDGNDYEGQSIFLFSAHLWRVWVLVSCSSSWDLTGLFIPVWSIKVLKLGTLQIGIAIVNLLGNPIVVH